MVITLDQIIVYGLIIGRFAGMIVSAPFFSNRQIFAMSKVVFVIWAAALLIFTVPLPAVVPSSTLAFVLALVAEFMIGVAIGFTADLMVSGIEFAGGLMDTQAGLSVASLLDPSTGRNAALFELMLKWIALIIFLSIDGHHMVLSALHKSFAVLPIGTPVNYPAGAKYMLSFGRDIFMIAVQISAPIILVVFIVDFAFGLLNRVAEQINVFQLGFQIKPTVSLVVFLAIAPGLVDRIIVLLKKTMELMVTMLTVMQTG